MAARAKGMKAKLPPQEKKNRNIKGTSHRGYSIESGKDQRKEKKRKKKEIEGEGVVSIISHEMK